VLRRVNTAILRSGRATFCTSLFATLRRAERGFTFTMASGGHPLPILCRDGGGTETVGRPGTLLGAYPDPRTVTVSTELEPGDTIVLYTDGITDVRPPHDLDPDALAAIVGRAATSADSAAAVVDGLGRELAAILPIADRNDDIAILVLKVPSTGDRKERHG
jgi:serine phosphatase RsbU (regulator of sigma subunit)